MAKAKSEFKGKDTADLAKLLREKREALRTFGMEVMSGKQKNVKAGRALRKDVARIMTEMNAPKA